MSSTLTRMTIGGMRLETEISKTVIPRMEPDLTDSLGDNDDPIDEGKYLRVTATYTDANGAGKTARAMSAYPVQARLLGAKNQSPDFEGAKVELSVAETAEVGDDVPGPVVATVSGPLRDGYTDLRAAHRCRGRPERHHRRCPAGRN